MNENKSIENAPVFNPSGLQRERDMMYEDRLRCIENRLTVLECKYEKNIDEKKAQKKEKKNVRS